MDGFVPMFQRSERSSFTSNEEARTAFRPGVTPCLARNEQSPPTDAAQEEQPRDTDAELAAAAIEVEERARTELHERTTALERQLSAVEPLLAELERLRSSLIHQATRDVGDIVEALCRRVLQEHLALDAQALTALVQRSLASFPPEDELVIHVPESALSAVRAALGDERQVLVDPELFAGCRIEARYATLESSVETAMQGVSEAVHTWVDARG